MALRFHANIYACFTVLTLLVVAATGPDVQAASPSAEAGRVPRLDTERVGHFGVAPAKDYFEYESKIPLVEQFMKTWSGKSRS